MSETDSIELDIATYKVKEAIYEIESIMSMGCLIGVSETQMVEKITNIQTMIYNVKQDFNVDLSYIEIQFARFVMAKRKYNIK